MKKIILLWFILNISWLNSVSEQEGFLENTVVRTPAGYQKIQDLFVGDVIYRENIMNNSIFTFQLNQHEKIIIKIDEYPHDIP